MKYRRLPRTISGALLCLMLPLTGHTSASASSAQATGLYGRNLIVNGTAEAGPGTMNDSTFIFPRGWEKISTPPTMGLTAMAYAAGEDLTASTPGPTDRGKNYFYGGPSNEKNTGAEQRINLSAAGAAIDAGKVTFTLSGWLGGYSSQRDAATFRATFLNAAGRSIGTAAIGPVTQSDRHDASELVTRRLAKLVPTGARTVVVDLLMTWHDGSDNDGLADDLSLVLSNRTS